MNDIVNITHFNNFYYFMAMHTRAHVEAVLTAALTADESLEHFCYALKGFRGFAIGLTAKRLFFIRLGLFSGKPKETIVIPRTDIADAHYDESKLSFAAAGGAHYNFMMQGTAGLDGNKNFDDARALFSALTT